MAFHVSPYGGESGSRNAVPGGEAPPRGLERNEEDERVEVRSSAPLPDAITLISADGAKVPLSMSRSRAVPEVGCAAGCETGCETGMDHARVCLAISDLSSATSTMMSVGYMPCADVRSLVQRVEGEQEQR